MALQHSILVGFVVALASVGAAYAHTTGVSREIPVGKYIIDAGYDPEAPRAGDRFLLDLNVLDMATRERLPFSDVWVRIVDEKTRATLFAAGIAYADIGPTTVLLQLPTKVSNSIAISMRFEKGEDTMAEGTFTLPIAPETRNYTDFAGVFGGAGAALVVIGAVYWFRSRSRRTVDGIMRR